MNYKYFKDPVIRFFAQRQIDAETFDRELAPGRKMYPMQATQVMMNLAGSHDTIRFINIAGEDEKRLMLAALFQMTYLGTPHIYYGDEVGLAGGKDPDNRRPFPWDWESDERRRTIHAFYKKMIGLRHEYTALRTGQFTSVFTKGKLFAYLRQDQNNRILIVINNERSARSLSLDLNAYKLGTLFEDQINGGQVRAENGILRLRLNGMTGAVLVEK
jgi:glycosidase